MDKIARSLVALLESPDPNLRLAAMRVVTALEMRTKAAVEGIAASLDSDEEALQVQALRALAQLGPADALPLVAPKILQGGAVRQHAAQVLALAGAASVPVLRKLYAGTDYHGRRAIASTLGQIGGTPAFQFLLKALPAEDLEMIKHLTGCLRQVLEGMPPAGRLAAAREVRTFLGAKTTLVNPHAVIAALILLGGISDPRVVEETKTLLLQYLDRLQPEPVRRNAAVSLARLPVPAAKADALIVKLVPFMCEPEWAPVPQNLLPLLQRLELSPRAAAKLAPLLAKSPHPSVQGSVLERLRGQDQPALATRVLPFLSSPHPRLRDAAEATLKSMPSAMEMLFELLLSTRDPDVPRRVELILRAYPEEARKRYAPRAVERLLVLYEKGDARWQPFLEFVRGTEPLLLQKRVSARLKALEKQGGAKRWEKMAALFRLLADQNLLTPEQRYGYGLLLLRQSRKDLAREARGQDPSLRVWTTLARQDGAQLVKSLVKERSLDAEDYYYLGFHLVESSDELKPYGVLLLSHVVERYPRHKLRRAAKQKLELQGRLPAARAGSPP